MPNAPKKTKRPERKNRKHAPHFLYVATIANRKTRGILAWDVVEERTIKTMQPLVDTVFSLVPHVDQFYSDGFSTYHELVYRQGRRAAHHDVARGKEQTYTVEGTNADLRCYVPALDRKGRCFPRHVDRLRSTLRLFITCYNHCCLARLKYPKRSFHPSNFLPLLF